jgi:predicted amidohydrolase
VGDVFVSNARAPLLTRFSGLARELGIYVALHLETKRDGHLFNTLVALGPGGKVVGVHHKFELFGSERDTHTPGERVMAFDTPFGRVGLLVCADVYGDPRLHDELTGDVGARIVALSARWTVSGATRWQAAFARDWGVYVVAANASRGPGKGGGVFDPKGRALAIDEGGQATVTVASIPVQR